MWSILLKTVISAAIIVSVSEVANRFPRLGALLLTLPLVSILAFILTWTEHRDLAGVSRLARETLILVPLGLPFFIPLGFADRLALGFWTAFGAGVGHHWSLVLAGAKVDLVGGLHKSGLPVKIS